MIGQAIVLALIPLSMLVSAAPAHGFLDDLQLDALLVITRMKTDSHPPSKTTIERIETLYAEGESLRNRGREREAADRFMQVLSHSREILSPSPPSIAPPRIRIKGTVPSGTPRCPSCHPPIPVPYRNGIGICPCTPRAAPAHIGPAGCRLRLSGLAQPAHPRRNRQARAKAPLPQPQNRSTTAAQRDRHQHSRPNHVPLPQR